MGMLINDDDKCWCGAYWNTNGSCSNGHAKETAEEKDVRVGMKNSVWHRFSCNICGEELKGGTRLVEFVLDEHLKKKHPEHYFAMEESVKAHDKARERAMAEVNKNYPCKSLGQYFKRLPPKSLQRLWRCPKCERLMSHHEKYFHEHNPKFCVKEGKDAVPGSE
jgi:hypothetical protein